MSTATKTLYETDFLKWAQETAGHLRRREFDQLDLAALIEEVEALGRSEKSAVWSRSAVLMAHLLKWEIQPNTRSGSWQHTIALQRDRLQRRVENSPSLRPYLKGNLAGIYGDAVRQAMRDTGLDRKQFPAENPFTLEKLLED